MLGFFFSYVWYPFLPARGPWEHPDVMAGLRPFGSGWIFTPILKQIMAGAAVSGGCFPSAHVSGTWALTFGLYAGANRKAAVVHGPGRPWASAWRAWTQISPRSRRVRRLRGRRRGGYVRVRRDATVAASVARSSC